MKKTLLFCAVLFAAGCSSEFTTKENESEDEKKTAIQKSQELFISGSMHDIKGHYAEAILEYQEALKFNPSAGIHYALGKNYLKLSKLVPALSHSKSAVKLESDHVEYNFLLATVYENARMKDSAAVVYEKIISLDSTNYQAYYNLAEIYEQSRPMKALSLYKSLLDLTGPEWSVLIKIAELNERFGNIDETISTVEELVALDPSNLELQKLLIESYIKAQEFEKALNLTEETLTLFPDDISLREFKGQALIRSDRWDEGAKEYIKLVESDTIPFESKVRIATAFMAESTQDTSLLDLTSTLLQTISKDTTDWQISAFQGEIEIQKGNDSAAVDHFKDAAKLAKWNLQVWNRLGILLFESQRFDEAKETMKEAVQNFPNDFVINLILGLTLSQDNSHQEALVALKNAMKINPTDLTALHAYGYTLNQLDKKDEAIIFLNKALEISPENVQILSSLGLIYDSQENFNKSDSVYLLALSIDSTDALIQNNYAYSLAERGIKLDEALALAENAIEADPKSSSYLDTIGWVYYKLNKFEEAKGYIEKAIEQDSTNGTLMDHLGDVLIELGLKTEAVKMWEEALKLNSKLIEINEKIQRAKSE